jgi:hypothetical protein
MCHLSVPQQHPTSGVEINLASQKRFTPCCFLCETVGFEVLLFIFCNGKGGKKPTTIQPPKRGPCISASYVKKGSFSSSFHLSRTGRAGCAVLVFPGNTKMA